MRVMTVFAVLVVSWFLVPHVRRVIDFATTLYKLRQARKSLRAMLELMQIREDYAINVVLIWQNMDEESGKGRCLPCVWKTVEDDDTVSYDYGLCKKVQETGRPIVPEGADACINLLDFPLFVLDSRLEVRDPPKYNDRG